MKIKFVVEIDTPVSDEGISRTQIKAVCDGYEYVRMGLQLAGVDPDCVKISMLERELEDK